MSKSNLGEENFANPLSTSPVTFLSSSAPLVAWRSLSLARSECFGLWVGLAWILSVVWHPILILHMCVSAGKFARPRGTF